MKNRYLCGIACVASLFLFGLTSCSKPGTFSPGKKLVRIQQGTDPNLANDTVWLIRYDGLGRMANIIDSLHKDTIVATYDANNHLVNSRIDGFGPGVIYTTNFIYTGILLTEIDVNINQTVDQYLYTYNGGVLSRINYNQDTGSGVFIPREYYLVTMSGGNITNEMHYLADNSLVDWITPTYSNLPNPFQQLSLFDADHYMGTDALYNPFNSPFAYFNKNLVTGLSDSLLNTVTGQRYLNVTVTDNYTISDSLLVTGAAEQDSYAQGWSTWKYYYQ